MLRHTLKPTFGLQNLPPLLLICDSPSRADAMKTTVIFKSRIMNNAILRLAPWPRINLPWIRQLEVGQGCLSVDFALLLMVYLLLRQGGKEGVRLGVDRCGNVPY